MRAIAVSEYGGSPTLVELPDREPGPGQLLIEIHAAGMNPMDRSIAAGDWEARGMHATFPLVMGCDLEGVVVAAAGKTAFVPGDEVFGQLVVLPLGSAGTYAERVLVEEEAPRVTLARVPEGLDPIIAAALPTAGGSALDLTERVEPLADKSVLIVGAAGGVGSFVTQLAAHAGATVIAVARAGAAPRLRGYGAADTIDHTAVSVTAAVHEAYPEGLDVLLDVASDGPAFVTLAGLIRPGGTALTTRYVADIDTLASAGVTGINFAVNMSPDLIARVGGEVLAGRLVPPPITEVTLDDAPAVLSPTHGGNTDGKTVIVNTST
jgi:NADPH2:quinone reductase